ncbi:MAG: nucleotidyl transferase AbiEii/AbiGii toxin family protein [Akkermansia sp.]|nr:nucleotidyl transferase AbiEii/AbiGii toxin family protein [Akkermansia sp.]
MIPESYINEWAQSHPWSTDAMVEQDLLISRALLAIYSDSFLQQELAFRGGTALHKIYLKPQPRYSEDIDLVQIHAGGIKPVMDHLRDALSFLGEPKTKSTPMSNKLIFRVEPEDSAISTIRIKLEINCREHFHVLPWNSVPYQVDSSWFSGSCMMTTYQLDELLGTKLRALYQRRKGRDLFDLYTALQQGEYSTEAILTSFCRYMETSAGYVPSSKEFMLNMEEKMQSSDFLSDTRPILLPGINYSPEQAFEAVQLTLIEHIDRYR